MDASGHPTAHGAWVGKVRPRVLLIEDSLAQLDLYVLLMEPEVEVMTATPGETGYVLACSEPPDAIIIDGLWPDVDGWDVCGRLLTNPQTTTTPVIVFTGDDGAYTRACVMHPVDAILKKPCPVDPLLTVLRRALASRRIN